MDNKRRLVKFMKRNLMGIGLVGITLFMTSCADLGVKPWERDTLSRPEMALIDSPMEAAFDDHVYFSKEASSGGRSFGGGGCGCN
jgi:uncharacterized protein DUF4266